MERKVGRNGKRAKEKEGWKETYTYRYMNLNLKISCTVTVE